MRRRNEWVSGLQPNPHWTPPTLTRMLLDRVKFSGPVWEPCHGEGWMADVIQSYGHLTIRSDIIDYGKAPDFLHDIIRHRPPEFPTPPTSLITNPPYVKCQRYVQRLLLTPSVQRAAFLTQSQTLGDYLNPDVVGEFGLRWIMPLPKKEKFWDWENQRYTPSQWMCCWFVLDRGWTDTFSGLI